MTPTASRPLEIYLGKLVTRKLSDGTFPHLRDELSRVTFRLFDH
jgi:hypothetical protein